MDLTPEIAHVLITAGGAVITAGTVIAVMKADFKNLKGAFWAHVQLDDKRHDEQTALMREHDRSIVKIAERTETSGVFSIATNRPRGGE